MPLASSLLPEIPSGQPLSLFQPRNTWNTRKKRVDPPRSSFRVFRLFRGCARARNSSVESSRATCWLQGLVLPGLARALVGDLAACWAGPWSELDAVIRCRDEHLVVLDR